MQPIIWAFGSSLVIMLIISFLPLGFTLKGKLFVVLASFALALGGLAATTSFPIWAIVLMLLVVAFFTAYMIDSRMGALVYAEQDKIEEVIVGDIELPLVNKQGENHELEVIGLQLEKSDVAINQVASPSSKEDLEIDEDISFLQERDSKVEFKPTIVDPQVEDHYLSDIESMLLEESVLETEKDWLDEVSVTKGKVEYKKIDVEYNQLDDTELELLFGLNEAATGHEENLPVRKSVPVVNIQK
jgi:hypothetical protein